jgi:hypothetical protein
VDVESGASRAERPEMSRLRWVGLVAAAAVVSLAGGCAVYSTPSGDVIGPAPVVVAPPTVVVSPFGYYGGYRHYQGPRYAPPRYYGRGPYGGPRYYGRPYYRD